MAELGFSMSDLYPGTSGIDTSELATPEADDQEALNENTSVAENSSGKEVSKKNIFLALGVMVALIIFFGGK